MHLLWNLFQVKVKIELTIKRNSIFQGQVGLNLQQFKQRTKNHKESTYLLTSTIIKVPIVFIDYSVIYCVIFIYTLSNLYCLLWKRYCILLLVFKLFEKKILLLVKKRVRVFDSILDFNRAFEEHFSSFCSARLW